jgi:hypothetical protein
MENQDESMKLEEEVINSNAARYQGYIETLNANFYIFSRNYQELTKLLEVTKNEEKMLQIWDLRNRQQLEMLLLEIIRLFHNFLASAKSLVDQTRIVINKRYKDTKFLDEYNKQINSRFVNNPLTGFIEDLRNYNLHYSLPVTNATFSIYKDQKTCQNAIDYSFVLIKPSLLIWKEWGKGKDFLNEAKDKIDISNLVDEYFKQIFDFHTWLINSLQEIHKDDLLWLAEMRQKIINAMSEEERKFRGLS